MTRNKTLSIPGPVPYDKIEDLHKRLDRAETLLAQLKEDLAENTKLTKDLKGSIQL